MARLTIYCEDWISRFFSYLEYLMSFFFLKWFSMSIPIFYCYLLGFCNYLFVIFFPACYCICHCLHSTRQLISCILSLIIMCFIFLWMKIDEIFLLLNENWSLCWVMIFVRFISLYVFNIDFYYMILMLTWYRQGSVDGYIGSFFW